MRKEMALFLSVIVYAVFMFVPDLVSTAAAINQPSSGTFAYDVYDIAVDKILKGPVGYVGGIGAMVIGAISLIGGRMLQAIPAILGGAVMLKADTLITGIGLIF
ncbi:MAG: hypothetical protein QXV73_04195 [Candidatus Micrarchaeia archaeon]